MKSLRIFIATLAAPLVPLVAFYALGLAMDGPDPVPGRELKRAAFLAVPGLLLVYPWALASGLVAVLALRGLGQFSAAAFATAGFLMGAVPGVIGAARSDNLDSGSAVIVFGIGGILVALAWRQLSGYRKPR
jgi:hypothetical protein